MSRWKNKKVGELFDVQLGKMLSKKSKQGELFPYLANFNVRWGSFDLSRMNAMNFSNREMAKYQLKKNDILMCEGGEIGRCAVWKEDDSQIFFQKALHRLRARNQHEINPYFFYAYMQHICSNNSLVKLVGETSIAHLTREKLIELKFPIPEKTHQDQIVKILATWDTAIEKTDALIAAKERQFGWLCQQFFTPNNEITSSWSSFKIKKFVKQRKEKSAPTNNMPLYSLTIEDGVTAKTDRYNREFLVKDKNSKTYKVVHPNDIVFNPSNLRWGAIARSEVSHKVVLSPIYEVYQIQDDKIDSDFLKYALTCKRQIAFFATKTEGTLVERMAVKADVFELCEISVPPSKETQKQVSNILNTAQQEINLLKNLATQYRTQKRGLMQKLLSGEWQLNPKEEKQ